MTTPAIPPIASKLIELAGTAIWDEIKKYPTPPPSSGAIPGLSGATKEDVGKVATLAVLRELARILSDWTDEDYSASDALDLVADTADEIAEAGGEGRD